MQNNNGLPPQSIEAEEMILGGIMLDPEAIARVYSVLLPEAFYIKAHTDIYQAMVSLYSAEKPTDLLSVTAKLEDLQMLPAIGGRNKLATLVDRTTNAVNIDHFALLVMDKYTRRQLIKAGSEIVQLGNETSEELSEVIDQSEQKIFAVSELSKGESSSTEPVFFESMVAELYLEMERRSLGVVKALKTEFYDLDKMLSGGLREDDLVVLMARPSMGKSAFACNIAYNVARQGFTTLIFSLEMSKELIGDRLLSSESKIELGRIQQGLLREHEWATSLRALETLEQVPLAIDDDPYTNLMSIRTKVRRLMSTPKGENLSLIVIDYLQLMVGSSDERKQVHAIGEVTRGLKLLARECKTPIILLSQLNRGAENRLNKRPILSDCRDSGRIEEDADIIIGLYRDEYYNPDTVDKGIAEAIVLKSRNSATGTTKLLFDPHICTFKNLAVYSA